MTEQNLKLDVRNGVSADEMILSLEGVLNSETAFEFRDRVRENDSGTLVLDMTHVRYVDSSGLGAIIAAYVSRERGCKRLLLAGTNDRVWDLFRMCGLTELFTRYPSVADAERAASAPA